MKLIRQIVLIIRLGQKLDLLLQDFLCGCDQVETSVNVKALTQECVSKKIAGRGRG